MCCSLRGRYFVCRWRGRVRPEAWRRLRRKHSRPVPVQKVRLRRCGKPGPAVISTQRLGTGQKDRDASCRCAACSGTSPKSSEAAARIERSVGTISTVSCPCGVCVCEPVLPAGPSFSGSAAVTIDSTSLRAALSVVDTPFAVRALWAGCEDHCAQRLCTDRDASIRGMQPRVSRLPGWL